MKMKFRKRPLEVEAEQFLEAILPHPEGVHTNGSEYWVETPRGTFFIKTGDWIVTGLNGVKYPIKHEVFIETYERI